jgi:hypothetical protein
LVSVSRQILTNINAGSVFDKTRRAARFLAQGPAHKLLGQA